MAKRLTLAMATGVSLVAFWGAALAQTGSSTTGPTQADFEVCNREAQMRVGASASPSGSASSDAPATTPRGPRGLTTIGTRGVGESATGGSGAGVSGGGLGSSTPSGTTTGIARPGAPSEGTGVARRGTSTAGVAGAAGAGAASGGALSGGSTLSGDSTLSSGSALSRVEATPDAQLRGVGDAGESDPQYRAAYRECMKARGF